MPPAWEIAVYLAVAGDVFDGVFLCCPFFPRDVLDEIWDIIKSVSEGVPSYSLISANGAYTGTPMQPMLRVHILYA